MSEYYSLLLNVHLPCPKPGHQKRNVHIDLTPSKHSQPAIFNKQTSTQASKQASKQKTKQTKKENHLRAWASLDQRLNSSNFELVQSSVQPGLEL